MLELANLSNESFDTKNLLGGKPQQLEQFLRECGLDGIEFLPCEPWNPALHPARYIKGVHLRFWPNWLDFWQGNTHELQREIGDKNKVRSLYGGSRRDWLELWRQNIRIAVSCGAQYVVFHVADARTSELYSRQFLHKDEEVVRAAAAVVNEVMGELPKECMLLFENLWWPGLTFQDPALAELLLKLTRHKNSGFMLDTGHLMNTNHSLGSEREAVDYVLKLMEKLGDLRNCIQGVHLHCSLSGSYVEAMRQEHAGSSGPLPDWQQVMDYILRIDQHKPFATAEAGRILSAIRPSWLVHEFIPTAYEDWEAKVACQRHSLGWE